MQVLFVAKEHPCPLRDYMEAECKNLVGLVNRMKDRLVRAKKQLIYMYVRNRVLRALRSVLFQQLKQLNVGTIAMDPDPYLCLLVLLDPEPFIKQKKSLEKP